MKYFKHQSDMRHDTKIRKLINRYGLEGYGLYCILVESITEGIDNENPLPELKDTCDDIAELYNSNSTKINEMAAFMINQGLFELDEITGRMLCSKIYKFLEMSATRSENVRILISNYKKVNKIEFDASLSVTKADCLLPTVPETETETETETLRTPAATRPTTKKSKDPYIHDYDTIINGVKSHSVELYNALTNFQQWRKSVKKPMTGYALHLIIIELNNLYPNDIKKQIECVNQSIRRGWLDVFAIKQDYFDSQKKTIDTKHSMAYKDGNVEGNEQYRAMKEREKLLKQNEVAK